MPRRDMRAFLLASVMTGLAAGRALAAPALLEVSINGRSDHVILPVEVSHDHLTVSSGDFAKLNLSLAAAGSSSVDLAHLPGLVAQVDDASQRLLLTVAATALPRQVYDLGAGGADLPAAQSATGVILHYDLSATAGDLRRFGSGLSGGGDFGLDFFMPEARISTTGFVTADSTGWHPARLDSALVFDNPQSLSHLILGDAINAAPDWGRAIRFGGVEWASDFALRPGLVTQPLPAFFGHSEVPATVDVYSGAARLFQQDVNPGPFELRNLPVLTGGGTATIVTRDVLGRETAQSVSLYTDAGLLAPGLESWALDAGFLRTHYGLDSLGYDSPMLSGDWRRGLSDTLTVEVHGETASGLALLGGGAEWGLGFGSIAADLAASGGDHAGLLASVSAHALAGPFNLYVQAMMASKGWRDLAALQPGEGGIAPPRLRYQFGATIDLDHAGTLGVSWLGVKQPDEGGYLQPARRLLSASWSVPLPDGMFVSLTGLRDLAAGATSAQISFNMPIGPYGLGSLSSSIDDGRAAGLALYDSPANPDGGFGYRLATGWQDGARFQGQADWIGDHVGLDGGVSLDHGTPSLRADASGALVFLRGSLFATHDPGGAVALVETGEKDIHIYRENRPVAVSDAEGEALLTGLDPWSPNRIGVESRDYDFNTLVEKTDAVVVPRRSSGVLLDFTPVSHHPLLATVTRGISMMTPVGARVVLDGDSRPLALGRDGQVFIADLEKPRGAVIELGTSRCHVVFQPNATQPLLCLREAAGAY